MRCGGGGSHAECRRVGYPGALELRSVNATLGSDNPPLNLIDSVMIGELNALFSRIEASETVAVVVFDSADPDFFLAHYDIAEIANGDAEQVAVATPPDQPTPG
jgi:hypothetical protein